jgi:hypothetical protein
VPASDDGTVKPAAVPTGREAWESAADVLADFVRKQEANRS